MLKIFKITLIVMLLSIFNIGKVFAGKIIESGYITAIATVDSTNNCLLELSKTRDGTPFRAGVFDCNTIYGQMIFDLANTAMTQLFQVNIIFVSSFQKGVTAIEME